MATISIRKTFEYTGTHVEAGDIESGTLIIVKGGDLIVEGNVGSHVVLEADNILLKKDAENDLYAVVKGNFEAQNVGENADITAFGKASVRNLGHNGWLRGRFGAAVTDDDAKCADHSIIIENGLACLFRKPAGETSEQHSCFEMQFKPNKPAN